MFSKAKRFDSAQLEQQSESKKDESSSVKSEPVTKIRPPVGTVKDAGIKKQVSRTVQKPVTKSLIKKDTKLKATPIVKLPQQNAAASDCSSVRSIKSCFLTPKPTVKKTLGTVTSLKKSSSTIGMFGKNKTDSAKKPVKDINEDLLASREVEIRNKDSTIKEYECQIEEMKREIKALENKLAQGISVQIHEIGEKLESVSLNDKNMKTKDLNQFSDTNVLQVHSSKKTKIESVEECTTVIANLENKINVLESDIFKLESEVNGKQMELSSMEELVCIRDSLCKDLQEKLTAKEASLKETMERFELVKSHHSLALEANESIRREYKIELDAIRSKLEEEKQAIITNAKSEQEMIKKDFQEETEDIRRELIRGKETAILEITKVYKSKENEMKAKLEQVEEKSREQLRLCEIQFEQRSQSMQEHWCHQQDELCRTLVELDAAKLAVANVNIKNQELSEEVQLLKMQKIMNSEESELNERCERAEKELKVQCENYENEIEQLKFDLNKAVEGRRKFEASLTVTRETVRVLGERLHSSDCEVEKLETKINKLIMAKQRLEEELSKYRNKLNSTVQECNDYRKALLDILGSRAALSEQHARMVAHNASLVESLQLVEGEAQRELGDIRDGLLADVDLIKKEAQEQIIQLRQELCCKQAFLDEAKSQLRSSMSAADDSRALLELAAQEITRLEVAHEDLQCQLHNQQSMETELSLLRQENEDLSIRLAQQASVLEALRKGAAPASPKKAPASAKSPLMQRKALRVGKENSHTHNVSPLRERNY